MGLITLPVKGIGILVSSVAESRKVLGWIREPKDALGAEWTTLRVLKQRGYTKPKGFLVGIKHGTPVYAGSEANVLIAARRGAGKTQQFIAAIKSIQYMDKRPDLIINDPAGDIFTGTSETLKALGYKATIIDMGNPVQKYDPLSYLIPALKYEFEADCKDIARLLVEDEPNSRQPHFYEFNQMLAKEAVAWAVKYDKTTLYNAIEATFDDKRRAKLIKRAELGKLENEIKAILRFDKLTGPEGNSMRTTAIRKLEPWTTQIIKEITDNGPDRGWTFDQLYNDKEPWAVFIKTGLRSDAGHFPRLVIGNAINHVKRLWNHTGKPLKKGLWLIVDEAHMLGNCAAVVDVNNELRKAGVNFMMSFVSLDLLKQTYPDWQTLVTGSEHVFMGGGSKDLDWMKLIKELAGKKKIQTKGESKSDHGESESKHDAFTDLAAMELLRGLDYEENIVMLADCVVRVKKPLAFKMKWRI